MPSSSDPAEPGAERQPHQQAAGGSVVGQFRTRAVREASALGHGHCTDIHALLALLRPETETTAHRVLTQLGADYEGARQAFRRHGATGSRQGATGEEGATSQPRVTPRLYGLLGAMAGIMVGSDEAELTGEHALLALLYYTDELGWTPIAELGLEPTAVTDSLCQQAVWVPSRSPVLPSRRPEPSDSVVYFLEEDSERVFPLLIQRLGGYPSWAVNVSDWKHGYQAVLAEEGLPVEQLIREAAADPASVIVVSLSEAREREPWLEATF